METTSLKELLVQDPLSQVTRRNRRWLLSISLVGAIMGLTDLVPTKIPSLGLLFSDADRGALLFIVAILIVYLAVAFLAYGLTDFLAWWRQIASAAIRESVAEFADDLHGLPREDDFPTLEAQYEFKFGQELQKRFGKLDQFIKPTSIFRACLDFALPIIVALVAFVLVLIRAIDIITIENV